MNPGIYGLGAATAAGGPYGLNGVPAPATVRVLVVAGGGGAPNGTASTARGGAGAGGVLEDSLFAVQLGTAYSVSVGGGGAVSSLGTNSRFGQIVAIGGGFFDTNSSTSLRGGSGSGNHLNTAGLTISTVMGSNGAIGSGNARGGGGGGAGSVGVAATASTGGNGGSGRLSTITGLTYAGGGGGGCASGQTGGTGGSSSGGNGGDGVNAATSGVANTGGGGGGGGQSATAGIAAGAAGGSGVVVLRFNSLLQIRIGSGLTATRESSAGDTIVTITAGTDVVSWS